MKVGNDMIRIREPKVSWLRSAAEAFTLIVCVFAWLGVIAAYQLTLT